MKSSIEKKKKKYLVEFVVIVAGISLSFLINEWRQEAAIENDLLAIRQSLLADKENLELLLEDHSGSLDALQVLVMHSLSDEPVDDISETVKGLSASYATFFPKVGAWNVLVSSGNLRWLKNSDLRASLTDYYDYIVPKVLDNNTLFDQNMSLGLLKWISGRYRTGIKAFTNSPITLKDIRETEFRIKLGESVGHYIWYVDLLEMALEQVGETLDSVEAAA